MIASGEQHSVRDFVVRAGERLKMRIEWRGDGLEEQGIDVALAEWSYALIQTSAQRRSIPCSGMRARLVRSLAGRRRLVSMHSSQKWSKRTSQLPARCAGETGGFKTFKYLE